MTTKEEVLAEVPAFYPWNPADLWTDVEISECEIMIQDNGDVYIEGLWGIKDHAGDFWSFYLRLDEGGVETIADFHTLEQCIQFEQMFVGCVNMIAPGTLQVRTKENMTWNDIKK